MRGRRLDADYRNRDSEGWIIPREGTKSRECYDLMKLNCTIHTLCRRLGIPIQAVYRMRCRIRTPDKHKEWHRDQMSRRKLTGPANVTP